jgi:membrane protein YqaA with SNARE-associated domain
MLRVALIIVLLGVYIASIIDVIRTPSLESRRLPVFVWLLIVIVLPVLGGIIWWFLGRMWPDRGRRRRQVVSPDDDARFLRQLDDEAWKRKMRERRGDPPPDEGEAPAPAGG